MRARGGTCPLASQNSMLFDFFERKWYVLSIFWANSMFLPPLPWKILPSPGLNIINVLRTAFTPADPKNIKKTVKLSIFFTHLGSTSVKTARKTVGEIDTWKKFCGRLFYYNFSFLNYISRYHEIEAILELILPKFSDFCC